MTSGLGPKPDHSFRCRTSGFAGCRDGRREASVGQATTFCFRSEMSSPIMSPASKGTGHSPPEVSSSKSRCPGMGQLALAGQPAIADAGGEVAVIDLEGRTLALEAQGAQHGKRAHAR